jgi:hypothetical protein
MYSTSAAYKTEIKKPSRSFECKITIGDRIYNNSDIVNVTIDGNIQPSDGFMIGTTVSKILDLTLINSGDTIYSTSQVKVEIGLKIGQTIEYIPMGLFNIDDVEKTDYTTKITAFDNMIKFESAYFSSLGDNPTLQQVVNELAAKTGVQFTGSLPTYIVKKLEGFTCREVLGYVASICGGNATITRDGKFTIVTPVDNGLIIDGSNYINYKREEVKYRVGKVTCKVGEEELSKGSLGIDSMELGFENPWITNNILQDIYNKLNGFNYLGYSMKWQGDLSLDVGDIVTVTDVKGVVRKHPVLSQKINYTGGLTAEIGAKGENKNKNSFSSSGDTSKKLNRIVTEIAIINKAFIDYAHINDADIVNLKAQTAKIDTAIINIATINTLLAGNITAANMQVGAITAGSGIIANGAIGDAQISSLSAVKITSGTVNTGLVDIASPDGRMIIKDNSILTYDYINNDLLKPFLRTQMGRIWDVVNGLLVARKDSGGNYVYGFEVRDKDGSTVMIDGQGVHNAGITPGAVDNDKIAPNANIDGAKLNIATVVTKINAGTTTIQGSKIYVDGKTLDLSFSTLKTRVTSQGEIISSQATTITALDNKINLKVDTQTYTTKMTGLDGSIGTLTTNLNKATSDISVLQNQISLKVEQSDITTAVEDVLEEIDSKISTVKVEIKLTTDSISSTVSSVQSSVTSLGTRVTSAESNIASLNNSITLKVNTSDFNSYKTSNDSAVSSLTSRISSAEIKITDSAIVSTVRSSSSYLSDLNSKADITTVASTYATKASMELTSTQLRLDFSSSGGCNLIKNSCFFNDRNYWNNWGSANSIAASNSANGYGRKLSFKTTGTNQGVEQAISGLEVGKTYTLSAYVCSVTGQGGIQVNNNGNYLANYTSSNGKWEWLTRTFTAAGTNILVQLGRGAGGSNGEYYFVAIQLQEGSVKTAWSPSPDEVYGGITTIDKDGVKVAHTNKSNTSYSQMSADGFYRYDGSTGREYHYLLATGIATISENSDAIITLGDEFKGKNFEVLVSIKSAKAASGASIELFSVAAGGKNIAAGTFKILGYMSSNYNPTLNKYTSYINGTWLLNDNTNLTSYPSFKGSMEVSWIAVA